VRVGVLGPGGVGGALAVRLARAGHEVVCVSRERTAEAISTNGLELEWEGRTLAAGVAAATSLREPVDLLVVAVKAHALEDALSRVSAPPGLVLPVMNGLEHPPIIRRRVGDRVAPGSIRIEAYAWEPGRIVQESSFTKIRFASATFPRRRLEPAADVLRGAGIEAHVEDDEHEVLWEKAARVAVLAPATALTQRAVGELRDDPEWRPLLEAAIAEACAVATVDGAPSTPGAHWAIIDTMPAGLSTSAARDVAAGRPAELDAITGAVVRAARRVGVSTPTLDDLLERCRVLSP
jgi:2-dehydropantoate 2-reductase